MPGAFLNADFQELGRMKAEEVQERGNGSVEFELELILKWTFRPSAGAATCSNLCLVRDKDSAPTKTDTSKLFCVWSWFRRLLLICLDVARHGTPDEARNMNLCPVRDKVWLSS